MREKKLTFIENLHYAFGEYGGNNITHWSFLDSDGPDVERICATLFLVADRDSAKKDERHRKLHAALPKRFYRLSVVEIENTLTPSVIEGVIREYEGKDATIRPFDQSDYADEKLGSFINRMVPGSMGGAKRKRRTYAEKSGTIKDKEAFCGRAIKQMHSIHDLSPEAIKLAGKLIDFIKKHNP